LLTIKLTEIASAKETEIIVTEEQVKVMFTKFKDFVLKRNIPECKKFIHDFVDEVLNCFNCNLINNCAIIWSEIYIIAFNGGNGDKLL
jgi:hypothetical protein